MIAWLFWPCLWLLIVCVYAVIISWLWPEVGMAIISLGDMTRCKR